MKKIKKGKLICGICNLPNFHYHCESIMCYDFNTDKKKHANKHLHKHMLKCISCKKNFLPHDDAVPVIRIGKNNHTNYLGTKCNKCVGRL